MNWSPDFQTDSIIILHYLQNVESRLSTFILNRLRIICDGTRVEECGHVKSPVASADVC